MNGQPTETQWFIARDGKQHGPLTDIEMRTFIAHSYLRITDLIWRPGMAEWLAAPIVFPNVFQPAAAEPAPAATNVPQTSASPAAQQSATPQAAPEFDATVQPRAERGLGKRLAIAAAAITLIGGGAFALATYHEPLMRMVSGSAPTPLKVEEAPVVAAQAPSSVPGSVADTAPPATSSTDPGAPASDQPPAPASSPDTATSAPTPPATPEAAASVAPTPAPETQVATLTPVPPPPVAPPSIEGSVMDVRLQKIPVWALIKKEYPDWYVSEIAAAETLVSEKKTDNEVAMHLAQGLVTLRRQNAEKALAASPEKLKKVAVAFLDHLKALRAQSVSACYGFISKGEISPAVVQSMEKPETAVALNAQAGAIFEAISEGAKTPTKHDAAAKADYDQLIKELSKLGWKEEDLQVFSNPKLLAKREPDQVCKMVQEWFVAHLAVPDKAVRDRLLYETLKPVVSG